MSENQNQTQDDAENTCDCPACSRTPEQLAAFEAATDALLHQAMHNVLDTRNAALDSGCDQASAVVAMSRHVANIVGSTIITIAENTGAPREVVAGMMVQHIQEMVQQAIDSSNDAVSVRVQMGGEGPLQHMQPAGRA